MRNTLVFLFVLLAFGAQAQTMNDRWLVQINNGKTEYAVENYNEAIGYFREAAKIVPTDTVAYSYLMDCGFKTQDMEVMEHAFSKLKALNHKQSLYHEMYIASLRDVAQDNSQAMKMTKEAKKKFPKNEGILFEEIKTYYKLKDYRKTARLLDAYNNLFPGREKAYKMLININLKQFNNLSKTKELLDEALIAFPDNFGFKKQEVDLLIRQKQYDKAEPMIQKLIQETPKDAILHYNLALIHFGRGEYKASAEICKKAIECDSTFVEAYYNVGTFYLTNGISYSAALNDMTLTQYQEQGAEFEFEAKRNFDFAKPFLEKAMELNPDDLDAFENFNTATELVNTIDHNLKQKAQSKMIADEYADNKDLASNVQILIDSTGMEVCASGEDCGLPAIRINKLELEYPDSAAKLFKGNAAKLKFTIQNITDRDAYDLEIVLMQTVTIPGLQYDATVKVDTLRSMQSLDFSLPISFNTQSVETPAIQQLNDVENKMRMFVREPKGLSSSLVEFNVNLGYNLADKKVAPTEDFEGFVPEEESRNFLLIIGINEYKHWTPLDNAVNDSKKIRETLSSRYTFDENNIFEIYDENATLRNIRNTLIKLKREITETDNLVIYYAGHGIYDQILQRGAWIPVDARTDNKLDYFSNERLLKYLDKLPTKHTFLIADACFSGSLFISDEMVKYQPNNDKLRSRWGLSSGNIEEVADGVAGTNSPFAQELIKALRENNRPQLPVSELISVVKFRVKNFNVQTPIGKPLAVEGNEGGEFVLYAREKEQ